MIVSFRSDQKIYLNGSYLQIVVFLGNPKHSKIHRVFMGCNLVSSPRAHGELLWSVNVRRPSCVVRRASSFVRRAASTIALKAYSSYTPGPVDSILGRKHHCDL